MPTLQLLGAESCARIRYGKFIKSSGIIIFEGMEIQERRQVWKMK